MHLPLQEYHGTNIVQIRPQENITTGAFNGQCTFIIDVGKDEMILPQSIYLAGRVSTSSCEYVINDNSVAVANSPLGLVSVNNNNIKPVGCIASGGLNNFFNKCQHEISGLNGSSVVQNIENYQQACSLLRLSHEHPKIATTQNNDPFILREMSKINDVSDVFANNSHTKLVVSTKSNIIESDVEYIIRNSFNQGLNMNTELSLSTKLPLSYFMQENKIYQSQHIIRFTIDPSYQSKFLNVINIRGTTNSIGLGTRSAFTGSYVQDAIAANQVALSVKDLYLYVEYVKINLPMGRPLGGSSFKHIFESWNCTLHSCPSGNIDNFILPCRPNLLKIIMGFRKTQKLLSNGTYEAPLINPEQIGFHPINLTQLYIKYLSDTYPQTQYTMNLINSLSQTVSDFSNNVAIQTSMGDSFDTIRAYEDYIINSEFETPEEAMTFDEWKNNPIFVFKFCNTTNQSSNIEINLQCNNTTTTTLDLTSNTPNRPAIGTPSELNGAVLYVLYVYRTMIESNFTEDNVTYTVSNLV